MLSLTKTALEILLAVLIFILAWHCGWFLFLYFLFQVEKAFREGTARQNAHSIFVCLALKLLEERVHIACKEIITLEKQVW